MKKLFWLFLFLIAPLPAKAQVPNFRDINLPPSHYGNISELIVAVGNWLLILVGVLAVIAIIYSGIMYMTAGGDQSKAEVAKKNLTWAILGLIIALLALVIINIITHEVL